MTKIASLDRVIRRGEVTGWQTGGPPLTETTRFWKCEACGGYFDVLDLGSVLDHEGELPHPVGDQRQKADMLPPAGRPCDGSRGLALCDPAHERHHEAALT